MRSLTWRARHSQPLFATRLYFLFCYQLASARLVIRRSVEIESPRFVSCLWFIGLIGLDTELPEINLISTSMLMYTPTRPRYPLATRCPRGMSYSYHDSGHYIFYPSSLLFLPIDELALTPSRKMETPRLSVCIGRIARGRGKSRGHAHDRL